MFPDLPRPRLSNLHCFPVNFLCSTFTATSFSESPWDFMESTLYFRFDPVLPLLSNLCIHLSGGR